MVDPKRLLEKARIQGATLDPAEIRDIITVVDRAAEWLEIALNPPSDLRPPEYLRGDEGEIGSYEKAIDRRVARMRQRQQRKDAGR
jgi:hypothetical protein